MTGYADAKPFPHQVIDDLFDPGELAAIVAEMPAARTPGWRIYEGHEESHKHEGGQHLWGPITRRFFARLANPDTLAWLSDLTGIDDLIFSAVGGGYHLIPEGGRLEMHTDFNEIDGLYRRLNLLVYLNADWTRDDGGCLELGAPESRITIVPTFNRTVIFTTSDWSLHGHPLPVAPGKTRRSLAAYYFTADPPPDFTCPHSTIWRP